ncbi:Cytochrome c oxidase subunit 6B1 [Trichoplax sp. H2]|uniref:Cytochrome c oxidase subunit n=1 Tax=Trichoplax adhaerens TaxID=10228 RepID=B3RMH5_TRIAD|nr:hypothetical protein TRIADDRAFT_21297 [Trichoplax adhaerens]EDV27850.1 hypothetical protein TRIADDRAFT_21297 [Trichoplax adhaerens]RDD37092.1 Cytochrome c oxidase subunit 6B1 [Trichoplax sp. H2]|eukprot:XP_002109684.1 hypothetical protein TRIADDRAFT_21297 [Trichoplax adhaerens]
MSEEKEKIVLKTAPFDNRFPNTNQTKNCWQNYVDYQRCIKAKGEDFEACQYFKRIYRIMCPNHWVEQWDEQVENGTFAGRI